MLPFSHWVSRVSEHGQPRNAVIVVWAVAALVTCTILPSMVAFTSLISAAGVPSAAAYGLICLCRLVLTPKRFPKPRWSLGRWSKPFQFIGVFWNAWVVAVLFSPYEFPVSGETLNCKFDLSPFFPPLSNEQDRPGNFSHEANPDVDAPIIMAGVTIFALISYWVTPEEAWLPRNRISHFIDSKGVSDESSNSNNDNDNKNSNDNPNVNASINKTTDDKL